jgi:hypothetical protein
MSVHTDFCEPLFSNTAIVLMLLLAWLVWESLSCKEQLYSNAPSIAPSSEQSR